MPLTFPPSSPPVPNPGVVHTDASSKDARQEDARVEEVKVRALMIRDALDGNTKTDADREPIGVPSLPGGCWGQGVETHEV